MKSCYLTLKIFVVLFIGSTIVYGQCPAPEKVIKPSNKKETRYAPGTQSTSGYLKPGSPYEMSIVVQEGFDYKISVAPANSDLGILPFEIYEMVTEKDAAGNYKKVKKVIASSDGSTPVEFTTDKARKLMIKVDFANANATKPECVAVLIEDRLTTKIGL